MKPEKTWRERQDEISRARAELDKAWERLMWLFPAVGVLAVLALALFMWFDGSLR